MSKLSPELEKMLERQKERLEQKEIKEQEAEEERKKQVADCLRGSYLKRTGRKEMKP